MVAKIFSLAALHFQDFLKSSDADTRTSRPAGEFVQGINLGGKAITVEGNLWDAYETALAQGLSVPGGTVLSTRIPVQPYAPPAIRQMLNTVVYRPHVLSIDCPLPNGSYEVYLWIMENFKTDWHALDISLGGTTVARKIGQLPFRQWERYGPYPVTVTDEMLNLAITTQNPDIHAHLMGMSIFRQGHS